MRVIRFCLLLSILAVIGLLPIYGQTDYATAALRGTVADPQGAVVSGATITVTNAATGVSKVVKTTGDGSFQVTYLQPGKYDVTVEAPGFSKEVAKDFELAVGQVAIYDVRLKVGTANEVVEVNSDSLPLIQTEQTQQANTINPQQVESLPNINKNFTQQVYTLPGVADSNATRSQTPGFTGFFTTGFSIGGSNGRNNLSTIDGGENEYGTGQYRVTTLPVEAIQEYQVNRNGFAAEFGFTNGSAINIVTKSGGNQYHGVAYGFFRDQNTEATNFFNGFLGLPKAFSQNIYMGGTLGGPVIKDKLFFFTAYDYQRADIPLFGNAGILTSPTVLGLSNPNLGNNNPTLGNCATQLNPATNQGLADQVCYVNALKTSGNPFLVGFGNGITPGLNPLNNPGLNTILTRESGVFDNQNRFQNASTKFDYQPNSRDSVSLRAAYAHNNYNMTPDPDGIPLFVRDFSVLGTWAHTFGASLVNQTLVQIVPRNAANNVPNAPLQGVNFSLGQLGPGNFGGTSAFGSSSLIPYLAHQQRYQFEDNVTWSKGAHTFKFGGSYRPANYHVEDDLWFNNQFDFRNGAIPLIALAPAAVQAQLVGFNLTHGFPATGPATTNLSAPQSFAFGIPVDMLAGFNNPKWQGWGHYIGTFAQDSWKVSPRLTLNFGGRFDTDHEPLPLGTNFYASPRVGFAYDPFGDHKTVIRAGGGIYTAPIDVLIPSYASLLDGSGKYINELLLALSPTNNKVAQLWGLGIANGHLPFGQLTAADFTAILGPNFNQPGATTAVTADPNYKNPYSVEASLSVARELAKNMSLELAYNMYHGVHLQEPLETGYAPIPAGGCSAALLVTFPGCTDKTGGPLYAPLGSQIQHITYESNGSSIYHGMTASLTKRYSSGLQFQVNYTWSKTLDNAIDFAGFQSWFRPSRLDLFRGISAFDFPHVVVGSAVYTTPFKTTQGNLLEKALADISLAPVVTVRSGLPFSVRTPTLANGLALDNNFAMPFNARRDDNRGANYATADMRFQKVVFINRDRGVSVHMLVEGTNIFNRVNFNKVNDVFDIGGFPTNGIVATAMGPVNLLTGPYTGLHGVVPTNPLQINQPLFYSSADQPRQIQFGLKLGF